MNEKLSDWLLQELSARLHTAFDDEGLQARHQEVIAKDKKYYDFWIKSQTPQALLYMSEESLSDAINFRKEKKDAEGTESVKYNPAKLTDLSNAIVGALHRPGDYKLIVQNNHYVIEEISE